MINIHFRNQFVEFRHQMEHKFLNIVGDSAIGKTTFYELVRDYYNDPQVNLGDKNIQAFPSVANAELVLNNTKGTVFVLDETDPFWEVKNAAGLLNRSDNYFIMINRSTDMGSMLMGLDDICTIHQVGSLYTFEPVYKRRPLTELGETVICEDSKSGKQFLDIVLHDITIESAGGKDKLGAKMRKLDKESYTLVYDRAGINIGYQRLLTYCKAKGINIVSEIDWDSFEAYLLHSSDYNIDFEEYPNAEVAATNALKNLFSEYDKSNLPSNLKLPVYWKVEDAVNLMNSSQNPKKITV